MFARKRPWNPDAEEPLPHATHPKASVSKRMDASARPTFVMRPEARRSDGARRHVAEVRHERAAAEQPAELVGADRQRDDEGGVAVMRALHLGDPGEHEALVRIVVLRRVRDAPSAPRERDRKSVV